MRLKQIHIDRFKRFADLTVTDIPQTARLIVLIGPNGCGKSSFLEALNQWHRMKAALNFSNDKDYLFPPNSPSDRYTKNAVDISWHDMDSSPSDPPVDWKTRMYVRSGYRHEADVSVSTYEKMGDIADLRSKELLTMITDDRSVSRNYKLLVSRGIMDMHDKGKKDTKFGHYIDETIKPIQDALQKLFPDLELSDLGSPMEQGTFFFSKGTSRNFRYLNLSGGEKAAFDLILDLVCVRRSFQNALYCIDEPESHMHTQLQARLLSVLDELMLPNCQLMIASHSIGMMRCALELKTKSPKEVFFLDFGIDNFDDTVVLRPAIPDRSLWKRVYQVALDDVASLVVPDRIVICEGEPKRSANTHTDGQAMSKHTTNLTTHGHDAQCFQAIFSERYPDTQFISGGGCTDIRNDSRHIEHALESMGINTKVIKLIDRDDLSDAEVKELSEDGVKVLPRRNLETYLFSNEILTELARTCESESKVTELLQKCDEVMEQARAEKGIVDNRKPVRRDLQRICVKTLGLTESGGSSDAFMRDTLAPLVKPNMTIYEELRNAIFGDDLGIVETNECATSSSDQ